MSSAFSVVASDGARAHHSKHMDLLIKLDRKQQHWFLFLRKILDWLQRHSEAPRKARVVCCCLLQTPALQPVVERFVSKGYTCYLGGGAKSRGNITMRGGAARGKHVRCMIQFKYI